MWGMSVKWRTRPSDFLGIEHSTQAYYFDKAVYLFGTTFDADLEEYTKSKGKKPDSARITQQKRERRIAAWLADDSTPQVKRYRDPVM
jgi:hypothetical protein